MPDADELLRMLARGGCIVSSGDSSPEEIAQARLCGRLHVDGRGFGCVYRPAVRLMPAEALEPATLPFLAAMAEPDWDHDRGQYAE